MLPSLVHLRKSCDMGVGYDDTTLPDNVRTRLVTIEHKRPAPPPSLYQQNVYGILSITVQDGDGRHEMETPEPVWSHCFQAIATEAYMAVADLTEKADKVDQFHYRRQHLVAIPQNAPNLQPQQFIQSDYGFDLSFVRGVIAEATGNLAKGLTLLAVGAPYTSSGQGGYSDYLENEDVERRERAENRMPELSGDPSESY